MGRKRFGTKDNRKHFRNVFFYPRNDRGNDIIIDKNLVDKLEKLHSALNCSKIIVNSGYRCGQHDKNVGGNGSGQHIKGTAADIVCYDKSGVVISSKRVSCAAQNIDFTGIANIDSTYTATHVDVRTSGKWYGNVALGVAGTNSSVTSDFYQYYVLSKNDVYGQAADDNPTKEVTIIIDGKTYTGTLTEK